MDNPKAKGIEVQIDTKKYPVVHKTHIFDIGFLIL